VVDVLAAIEPGAPLARVHLAPEGGEPSADRPASSSAEGEAAIPEATVSGNVFQHVRERRGDVATAFARCAAIVEGRFRVSWAYQAPIEPQVATAWLEPDGTLAVMATAQEPSSPGTSSRSCTAWRRPGRVAALPVGVAGAKQVMIEPIVAGAALRLRSPVRLVLDRRDDFTSTNPAQGIVLDVRIGARGSGRLAGLAARIVYDAGAYVENSWQWFAPRLITGPYRWPAFDVEALGVRTNRFGAGNYRAPSGPQGVFALESLIDELAGRLGVDPVELRAANLVTEGESMVDGTPWPRIAARDCLDRLRGHPLWVNRGRLGRGEGVGLAIAVWAGAMQPAAAGCRLEPDGTLTVVTGSVDISGTASGFAVIATAGRSAFHWRTSRSSPPTPRPPHSPRPPTRAPSPMPRGGPSSRRSPRRVTGSSPSPPPSSRSHPTTWKSSTASSGRGDHRRPAVASLTSQRS
jgi:CO/xanthine dehydrogenase Mo-binding subunit